MKKMVLGAAAALTLIAAYFAPDEEGGVVGPAGATPRAVAPAAPPQAAPVAGLMSIRPDLRIHPRRDDSDLGNVFAKQSWQAEPPKKVLPAEGDDAPAPAKPRRAAQAASGAPPLPFQFLGRFVDDGQAAYFLQAGERNVVARVGEQVDDSYRLDSASDDTLTFTYLPLKQQQQLLVGDMN
ncbi:MAG: hypothetical protein V4754_16720 [Pseudomonadota bacterium]